MFCWLVGVLAGFLSVVSAQAVEPVPVINVVFLPVGFSDPKDIGEFRALVKRYSDYLLTYEPFKSRAEHFRFHAVETSSPLECARSGRLVVCDPIAAKKIVQLKRIPFDKIVVILNTHEYAGSGGEVAVAYRGGLGDRVFVHEFGHSFAGLHDEYVSINEQGPLDAKPHLNCHAGLPPNEQWEKLGAKPQYTQGCTYANWYRSTPDSIMSSMNHEYFNSVSQAILNEVIDRYLAAKRLPARRGD